MSRRTRLLSAITVIAIAALALVGGASVFAKTKKAKAKKTTSVTYSATVKQAGGFDYTAGMGKDKVLGSFAITYKNKIVPSNGSIKVTAKPVTLYTKTGSLTGTASTTLTIGTGGAATASNGKLKLTKGAGSLKGHSYVGTFTGTGNVTTSDFTFTTKATYK